MTAKVSGPQAVGRRGRPGEPDAVAQHLGVQGGGGVGRAAAQAGQRPRAGRRRSPGSCGRGPAPPADRSARACGARAASASACAQAGGQLRPGGLDLGRGRVDQPAPGLDGRARGDQPPARDGQLVGQPGPARCRPRAAGSWPARCARRRGGAQLLDPLQVLERGVQVVDPERLLGRLEMPDQRLAKRQAEPAGAPRLVDPVRALADRAVPLQRGPAVPASRRARLAAPPG